MDFQNRSDINETLPVIAPKSLVMIAANTGGPEALAEIIPKLPRDLSMAVVVIQQMRPGFASLIARELDAVSAMNVVEAEDGNSNMDDRPVRYGTIHLAIQIISGLKGEMVVFKLQKKNGFTLVEIMIVVLIIAMLLAVGIPNFLRARGVSRSRACQANLRQISTAKDTWAMVNKVNNSSTPTPCDLVSEYMKSQTENVLPICPTSGNYTIGNLSTDPRCSIGTNTTPDDYDDHKLIR